MFTRMALLTAVLALSVAAPAPAAQVIVGNYDQQGAVAVAGCPTANLSAFGIETRLDAAFTANPVALCGGADQLSFGGSLAQATAVEPIASVTAAGADRRIDLGIAAASDGTAHLPEAATWAMMLLGFSGMGYALRRRSPTKARVRFT